MKAKDIRVRGKKLDELTKEESAAAISFLVNYICKVEAAQQSVQRTDATEPPCEVASGCYFGQDGKCLRGGVCR